MPGDYKSVKVKGIYSVEAGEAAAEASEEAPEEASESVSVTVSEPEPVPITPIGKH